MQFFRDLRAHRMGRALGLVFAYVLVVQSLLLPLRALAQSLPDHDSVLCSTLASPLVENGVSDGLDPQSRKAERGSESLPHHGCEIGCVMQHVTVLPFVHDKQALRLAFIVLTFAAGLGQGFAYDPFAVPMLAQGKAPGAPPLV